MSQSAAFDLFLDESGTFTETSTDSAELAAALRQSRLFPSQLAGLLAPRGELTPSKTRDVLNESLKAAGLPPQPVHARDLPRASYDDVVRGVVERIGRRGWQPVRLVNRERVRYGDRATTYTHLVAELVLRVCQLNALTAPRISLRLFPAIVVRGESPTGVLEEIEKEDYLKRVQQYLGFAAVRRGLARASAAWRLEGLHIRSGKKDPEIQLCDVLSHASHDDYRPCQPATAHALREAFGPYDFSLTFLELIERVDQQLAAGAPGLALVSLAETFCGVAMGDDLQAAAHSRLEEVRGRLAGLGAPARDPHLALVLAWLEQTIEVRRAIDLGYRLSTWLLDEVSAPLASQLAAGAEAGSLDWFAYALRTWALTAANHRGAVRAARCQAQDMERLLPAIAGHWEHATLLMRGLVAHGVHLTDCFEHGRACARMGVAANYYGELGSLFQAALPEVFPARVRSDLHGRVLGTWLQSELLAGLCHDDQARLDRARELSERAIDEFPAEADRERQYQYRSQIEAAAGNFTDARRWLARSLHLADDSHDALASAILLLAGQPAVAEGFVQLHWFRLGAAACLAGASDESKDFLAAVEKHRALEWRWSRTDGPTDYPAHGILRRVAVLHALRGETAPALDVLRRLTQLLSGEQADRFVLQTVRLAAHAETAAALGPARGKLVGRILDHRDAMGPGLAQMLASLEVDTAAEFPGLWRAFQDWPAAVKAALGGDPSAFGALARLARRVGY
jgi:tetratricopeptide (TPR) repeat protein